MNDAALELRELRYSLVELIEKLNDWPKGQQNPNAALIQVAQAVRLLAHHIEMVRERER